MRSVTTARRPNRLPIILLALLTASCSSALVADETDKPIIESALREAREIISDELFGHYDITSLVALKSEPLRDLDLPATDYGLVAVKLTFSAKRNATKHRDLNPAMFERGSPMCVDWLYLHCGVPVGHVFDGTLQLLLAVDRHGLWRVVSPHWRSRRLYPLHGYLLLEGREKEGYVLFPKQPAR